MVSCEAISTLQIYLQHEEGALPALVQFLKVQDQKHKTRMYSIVYYISKQTKNLSDD